MRKFADALLALVTAVSLIGMMALIVFGASWVLRQLGVGH